MMCSHLYAINMRSKKTCTYMLLHLNMLVKLITPKTFIENQIVQRSCMFCPPLPHLL